MQLQTAQADLKSAQKRIDTLHKALKGQEEDFGSSGGEEDEYSLSKQDEENENYSSSDSSYKIGEYGTSSGLSEDGEGTPRRVQQSSRGKRSSLKRYGGGDNFDFKSRRSRSRDLDEEFEPSSRRKNYSSKLSDDEDFTSRRRTKLSSDDEDFTSTRRGLSKYDISDDDDLEIGSRPKKTYTSRLSDDDFESKQKKDYSSKVSDEDDAKFSSRRRVALSSDDDDDLMTSRSRRNRDNDLGLTGRSRYRERIQLSDDDDDDFLSRQKKTAVKLSDDEDSPDLGSTRVRRDRSTDLVSDDTQLSPKPARRARIKVSDDEDLDFTSRTKRGLSSGKLSDEDDFSKREEKGGKLEVKFNGMAETASSRRHSTPVSPKMGSREPPETSGKPPANFDPEQRRPSLKEKLTDEQQAVHQAAMRRRRRQRRRTVEAETRIGSNPTSPEHQATNGHT